MKKELMAKVCRKRAKIADILFLTFLFSFFSCHDNPWVIEITDVLFECKNDHKWGGWTLISHATCVVDGEEKRTCSKDKAHTEKRAVPMLGHDWVGGVCALCGEDKPAVPVTGVSISPTLNLAAGETRTLAATVTPPEANQAVIWSSSDVSVASVTGGAVTGHKAGMAAVTATAEGGLAAACVVTVIELAEGTYTVTVNPNNPAMGSVFTIPAITSAEVGVTINIAATANDGFRFVNWETASPGVTFGSTIAAVTSFAMPPNAVEITAVFEAIPVYTVTVNPNNPAMGSAFTIPAITSAKAGDTINIAATANNGYRFVEWETESTGVTIANATAAITSFFMPSNAVVITAVFEAISASSFNIAVNSNDTAMGSASATPNLAAAGTTVTLTAEANSGYSFVNWTTASPSVIFANANSANTTFIMPDNAVTVTAVFEVLTYTVTFNKNNTDAGSTEASPQTKTVIHPATTIDALPAPPARTGYSFVEWNTMANGSGTAFSAATQVTGNIIVYAQWNLIGLIDMVTVPAGTFLRADSQTITVSSFRMGKTEVTQRQWARIMLENVNGIPVNSSYFSSGVDAPNRPVENITWYEILVFCNRLSIAEGLSPAYSISGNTNPDNWGEVPTVNNATWNAVIMVEGSKGYRMPTEAQWEYACRAGTTTVWSYGDIADGDYMWYNANSAGSTQPVGIKLPNDWGLYDMHGNVWEWCWDWYANPYPTDNLTDPEGASSGTMRSCRGGSYFNPASYPVTYRGYDDPPEQRHPEIGFRVARPAP